MAEGKAKVKASSGLNVREGAGTNFSKIGKLKNGTSMTYYEDNNGWLQIDYLGQKGYVSKQYTTITEALTSGGSTKESESKPASSSDSKTSSSSSSKKSSGTVEVTASSLRIRKGPGTSYDILGNLSKGDVVSYSEEKDGWLKISHNGKDGWICKEYTKVTTKSSSGSDKKETGSSKKETDSSKKETDSGKKGSDSGKKEDASDATTMYVTASSLNVRSGPSTSHDKIGKLSEGEKVTVIGHEADGWKKINYKDGTGYVSGEYLTKDKPSTLGTTGLEAVQYARQFEGRYTYELAQEKAIPYLTADCGYDNNCANFVTAVLKNFGLWKTHYISVANVKANLADNGYKKVDRSEAKPGDIWMQKDADHSHVELVNTSGAKDLIGSNNGSKSSKKQKVSINTKSHHEYYHKS